MKVLEREARRAAIRRTVCKDGHRLEAEVRQATIGTDQVRDWRVCLDCKTWIPA